jgi:hypothetical protein
MRLLLVVLIAGCSLMEPKMQSVKAPVPVPEITEVPAHMQDMMDYVSRLQNKTALEFAWEYNYASTYYRNSTEPAEQFMFLMLLLQADTKYFDTRVAANQLQQIKSSHALPSDLRAFSDILDVLLRQQIAAKKEVQQLSMQLNASRAEIGLLKQKINAIKNIERNLIRRIGSDATDNGHR